MVVEQQGTTISAIEDALHFGRGTITKWNKSDPSTAKLSAVAKYLDVPISVLLGDSELPERKIIPDADLKFALWNGEQGMTDAQFQEVKQFAAFVKERDQK